VTALFVVYPRLEWLETVKDNAAKEVLRGNQK